MPRSRRRALRFAISIAVPLLAFLTLGAWSLSSSPGSSPDDNFHLPSIWCGQGERAGLCEKADDVLSRKVPATTVNSVCMAFHPDRPANCWDPSDERLVTVPRANIDRLYPPLFYATMSTFVTDDFEASIVSMRLFNSALAVGVIALTFFVLPRWIRPALLLSVAATWVPLGLFVVASTNPSSWAFIAAAVVWVALYGSTQTGGWRSVSLSGIAVLGTVLGAGARADAGAFAVFAVILVAILAWRRRTSTLVPAIGAVAVICIGAFFYLTSSQSAAAIQGLDHATPPLTPGQQITNFLGVPGLWIGALGGAGLGWMDTMLPEVVSVLAFGLFSGAIYVGLGRTRTSRAIAVALGVVAMWLVPFVLLAQSHAVIGTQVQPRYILPLMTMTVAIASLRPDALRAWGGARYVFAGIALVIAQGVALFQNLRRYTVGLGGAPLNVDASREWWWPNVASPLTVWTVGCLAFTAMVVLVGVAVWQRVPRDVDREPAHDATAVDDADIILVPGTAAHLEHHAGQPRSSFVDPVRPAGA